MNPIVDQFCPVDPVLLLEVGVEPSLDVVDDRFPAVSSQGYRCSASESLRPSDIDSRIVIVDEISISRSIHHGQPQLDPVLLDIYPRKIPQISIPRNSYYMS